MCNVQKFFKKSNSFVWNCEGLQYCFITIFHTVCLFSVCSLKCLCFRKRFVSLRIFTFIFYFFKNKYILSSLDESHKSFNPCTHVHERENHIRKWKIILGYNFLVKGFWLRFWLHKKYFAIVKFIIVEAFFWKEP